MTNGMIAGNAAAGDIKVEMYTGGPPENEIVLKTVAERHTDTSLQELIRTTLGVLGVTGTKVIVADRTAFDWVIQARLETAARQLYPKISTDALPAPTILPKSTHAQKQRRVHLYLPGNRPDRLSDCRTFSPDGIVLDLADSVPAAEKEAARILVRHALRDFDFGDSERQIRINRLPDGLGDLPSLIPHRPNLILIPGVEAAQDVIETVNAINQIATRHQIMDPIWVMPIIETAKAILAVHEIAKASEQVAAVAFGSAEFTANIRATPTRDGKECLLARSHIILAARAAGVQPIDLGLAGEMTDEQFRTIAAETIALGFEGMGVSEPHRIELIYNIFQKKEELSPAFP